MKKTSCSHAQNVFLSFILRRRILQALHIRESDRRTLPYPNIHFLMKIAGSAGRRTDSDSRSLLWTAYISNYRAYMSFLFRNIRFCASFPLSALPCLKGYRIPLQSKSSEKISAAAMNKRSCCWQTVPSFPQRK